MNRTAVESSNVASIGYDPAQQVVEVEFKGGRVYHYHDVSPEEWESRTEAESIGKWVASVLKPSHDFAHGEFEPEEDDLTDEEETEQHDAEHGDDPTEIGDEEE